MGARVEQAGLDCSRNLDRKPGLFSAIQEKSGTQQKSTVVAEWMWVDGLWTRDKKKIGVVSEWWQQTSD